MSSFKPAFAALCMASLGIALWGCGKKEANAEAKKVNFAGISGEKERIRQWATEKGVPGLEAILKDEASSSADHIAAISGLGTLKDNKDATAALVRLARGADLEDAYWAIIALGVQGAPETGELLREFSKSPDARRREAACLGIYEYGDETLYPLIDEALRDDDRAVKAAAELSKRRIQDRGAAASR